MGFAPTKTKDKDTGKTTYTFSLCFPELLGLITLAVIGFTWLFIFGVIVGRGYQPEDAVPELKHFMPAQQEAATQLPEKPALPVANAEKPAESSKKSAPAQPSPAVEEQLAQLTPKRVAPAPAETKVLEAEQLNFFEQLKGKEAKIEQPVVMPTPKAAPKAKSSATASNSNALKKALSQSKPAKSAKKKTLAKESQQFEYVFQIAASTEKNAASKLRDSIRSKGFTTSLATAVLNTTKWYRINVHFVGTSKDVSIFKSKLAVAGYRNPLLKRKTKR